MRKLRPNTSPRHKPRFEGEVYGNLYCPCGWCKDRHAKAIATKLNFGSGDFLAWRYESPCLEKVERQALRMIK